MRHMEYMKMKAEQAMQQSDNIEMQRGLFDKIEKPKHYNIGIEPAEYMESLNIAEDYYAGNIIKYISRYKYKNGTEDVRKVSLGFPRVPEGSPHVPEGSPNGTRRSGRSPTVSRRCPKVPRRFS